MISPAVGFLLRSWFVLLLTVAGTRAGSGSKGNMLRRVELTGDGAETATMMTPPQNH